MRSYLSYTKQSDDDNWERLPMTQYIQKDNVEKKTNQI